MGRKKLVKGTYGYVDKFKKQKLTSMILWMIVIGCLLFIPWIILKTRLNYFTIGAVVMVLPAAKSVVASILIHPYKTVPKEIYDKVQKVLTPDMELLCDLVMTKYEGSMCLSLAVVYNKNVYAYALPQKWSKQEIKSFLTTIVKTSQSTQKPEVYTDLNTFIRVLEKLAKQSKEETVDQSQLIQNLLSYSV